MAGWPRVARAGLVGAMTTALCVTGVFSSPSAVAVTDENPDFILIEQDLEHILKQIQIAEAHAAGGRLLCDEPTDVSGKCVTDPALPLGLRTVDGSFNNLLNPSFGASDQPFPQLLQPQWRTAEAVPPGVPPAMANQAGEMDVCGGATTCYSQTDGFVYDTKPRMISNLIVDQSVNNPAAINAFEAHEEAGATNDGSQVFIPNTAPDEALSAPFNAWFTFFGQFFDHGLDLVNKGGNGTVVVPLHPDDPLVTHGPDGVAGTGDEVPPNRRFLTLTRATRLPGPDGEVGTADDQHNNQTTPFIDQNQTYTSHPSHQTFLREYTLVDDNLPGHPADAHPHATGKLLDSPEGGIPTWNDVKAQAHDVLGIDLVDFDVLNVPMLVTDLYGNFTPGPNGFPQVVLEDDTTDEGSIGTPAPTEDAVKTGHAFLDDIANGAAPTPPTPENPNPPGYDNVALGDHYVTGDGRGNENIALTTVHHVFHSEHNRMLDEIKEILDKPENAELKKAFQGLDNDYEELMGEPLPDGPEADDWSYEQRLFQAAKFPTEMQYQHLVFEEFARKIQPAIDPIVLNENSYDATINPAIRAEFAHVVYRFGHSMLTEDIDRNLPGVMTSEEGRVSLLDGFLNPTTFDNNGALTPDQAAGAVVNGTTNQVGGQIDEMITSTLRNNLLGLPLDLATINIVRSRDAGVPPLQVARKTFFEESGDPMLEPYSSWVDFGLSLKNGDNFGRDTNFPNASLVNFVAAYGTHPTITAVTSIEGRRAAAENLVNWEGNANAPADAEAFMNSTGTSWSAPSGTNTGLERVDFWVGGLAEALEPFGSMLGSTFNYVFEQQLEDLQFGDRFYYLFRNQGNQLFSALEGNSFSGLIQRNTDASLLPADIFAVADPFLDLENLPNPWPAGLSQMPDGTYRWDGDEHIEIHGNRTSGDLIRAGQGDDALWGYGGNDRIEGGSGNDSHIGGPGDDILTDTFGDDNIKGGFGNDAIKGGAGDDLLLAGHGDDFVATGNDFKTVFGSTGNDVILGGLGRDTVFAGEGDDWIEGGAHADLMQGDNANQFQNNPFGGNDIVDGGAGNDDMEGEGGHDILIGRQNGTDRMEGMHGYDWVTYRGETVGVDVDLRFSVLQRPDQQAIRDRFDLVEGISGGAGDDVLRGMGRAIDDIPDVDLNEHKMTEESISQITGLGQLLDPGHVQDYGDRFTEQSIGFDTDGVSNLLLGGSGSDIFESRVGDDFIDGDAYLDVFMRANGVRYNNPSNTNLQNRIFNGTVNPGDINIFRQIRTDPGQGDVLDTAVFAADRSQYTINELGDGYWEVVHNLGDGEAEEAEGQDILRNIELVRFSNGCFVLETMESCGSFGTAAITYPGDAPVEDEPVTGTVSINLADVPNPQDIQFRWMATDFEDVNGQADWLTAAVQSVNKAQDCIEEAGVLTCTMEFTPGDAEFDTALRLEVTFSDGGVLRSIISPVTTAGVVGLNDTPTAPVLSTNDPMEGKRVSVSGLADDDGLEEAGETLQWQWQVEDTPGNWTTVTTNPFNITGFIPTADQVGKRLRVQVVYDDDAGFSNTATSDPTNPIAGFIADPTAPAAPSISGVTVLSADSIEVTWQAPDNDGGSPITEYVVTAWQGNRIVDDRVVAADAASVVFDGLTEGTNYRFSVTARNAVGLGMESGLSEAVSPGVVLEVVSSNPADGATDVDVAANVTVDFSEPITGYTGSNVTLVRVDTLESVPFTRGYAAADNRLTVRPFGNTADALEPQTTYRLTLNGGASAIRTLDGVPLETTSITFTTGDLPTGTAPTVEDTDPVENSTGADVGTNIRVWFSEPITGFNGAAVRLIRVDTDEAVPFSRGFSAANGNRLILRPYRNTAQDLAPGTQYRVELVGGLNRIRSLDGVPFETWSFTFTTAP